MKKKCVFFDADGTILDIEKGVPEETKLAIKNLIHNGHRVFLCTGRSRAYIPKEVFYGHDYQFRCLYGIWREVYSK